MDASSPWILICFALAIVSVTLLLVVDIHIYAYRDFNQIRSKLLFWLYLTLTVEEIAYLPFAYIQVPGLCRFMAWLHYYCGLTSVLLIYLLSLHYFSYVSNEKNARPINKFISKNGLRLAFGFPMITILPFATNSYGVSNNLTCTLPHESNVANIWAYTIFYGWVMLLLLFALAHFLYSFLQVAHFHLGLHRQLFISCGAYILIAFIAWIPRLLERIFQFRINHSVNTGNIATLLPIYAAGILYGVIYFIDFGFINPSKTESFDAVNRHMSIGSITFDAEALRNVVSDDLPSDRTNSDQSKQSRPVSLSLQRHNQLFEKEFRKGKSSNPFQIISPGAGYRRHESPESRSPSLHSPVSSPITKSSASNISRGMSTKFRWSSKRLEKQPIPTSPASTML
jgi:hypothetical protein